MKKINLKNRKVIIWGAITTTAILATIIPIVVIENSKKEKYHLSLKSKAFSKVADEIQKADIDTSKLPKGITIISIKPSEKITDGTTVIITLSNKHTIELKRLKPYYVKVHDTLKDPSKGLKASDLNQLAKKTILPSQFVDKEKIRTKIFDKLSNYSFKNKLKIKDSQISFKPDDKSGKLGVLIKLGSKHHNVELAGFQTGKEAAVLKTVKNYFNSENKLQIKEYASVIAKFIKDVNTLNIITGTKIPLNKSSKKITYEVSATGNDSDGKITISIVIKEKSSNNTLLFKKDIFGFTKDEIAKFEDNTSSNDIYEAWNLLQKITARINNAIKMKEWKLASEIASRIKESLPLTFKINTDIDLTGTVFSKNTVNYKIINIDDKKGTFWLFITPKESKYSKIVQIQTKKESEIKQYKKNKNLS